MIRCSGHFATVKRNSFEFIGMLLPPDLIGNITISPVGWHKYVPLIKIVQRFSCSSFFFFHLLPFSVISIRHPKETWQILMESNLRRERGNIGLGSTKEYVYLILSYKNQYYYSNNLCIHNYSVSQFAK